MLRGHAERRSRVDRIASSLPETTQRPGGEKGLHTAFMVRNRTFSYFTENHHGDGRLALIFRAPLGEQAALVASEPERFFVPPYLGHRGWVGLWLDTPRIERSEVEEIIVESYRSVAPKRLIALLA
jgi:hypothetical protein